MSATPEYEFVLPSSGKALKWKPLRAAVSIQIASQYPNASQAGFRQAALLGARVTMFDGQPKTGLAYGEISQWDEFDLEAFGEHIEEQETIRRMVLRKKGSDGQVGAKQAFSAAIEEMQLAANRMGQAVTAIMVAADAMRAEFDPLGSPPSST